MHIPGFSGLAPSTRLDLQRWIFNVRLGGIWLWPYLSPRCGRRPDEVDRRYASGPRALER